MDNATYPSGVILNEFLANPKTRYSGEWVELYNGSATSVDLGGWKVDDGEGGGSPHTLPAGTIVAPGSYLVVDLPGALLNNSGDSVRLIQPGGVVADTTSYNSSAADVSRSRAPDGSWYDSDEPTPGAPNTPPSVAATSTNAAASSSVGQSPGGSAPGTIPSGIQLSEVLAAPKDAFDAEWIEIANNSDTTADLAGWKLDDDEGGGAPYSLPANSLIGPHGFLVVTMPRALFNNTGDLVRLIRPDGVVADELSYSAAIADLSFCLLGSAWVPKCPPTPGAPNRRATDATEPDARGLQTPPPADLSAASEESISLAELAADPMIATPLPRRSVVLRGAESGGFIYALAIPGSVYRGVAVRTPTPWPTTAPEPAPRLSTMAIRTAAPAPSSMPTGPIAGGVLIVLGIITAGYAVLRRRSTAVALNEPADAPPEQAVDMG